MAQKSSRSGLGVRGKLIALSAGTAFFALLLSCAAFVYYDRVSYAEAKRGTLSVLVQAVSQSAYGPTALQDQDSARAILTLLESEPSAQLGAIYTRDGALLAHWTREPNAAKVPNALAALDRRDGSRDGQLRLTHAIEGEQRVGVLHVVFSTAEIAARSARFVQIAGVVLVCAVLVAVLFATLAQRVFTRPVSILSAAARRVRAEQAFDTRAERVSDDEFGELTDAFNAMLSMIQVRDRELLDHRAHLAQLVEAGSKDLERRNQEVRLVLDNVDQGLLMIDRDGLPSAERSAIFDRWFGAPEPGQAFGGLLGRVSPEFKQQFALQWQQLIDGFLPLKLNLAQLPAALTSSDGRHYQLAYRAIGADPERFDKLLVVVSDMTDLVAKAENEAQQKQLIALLEHISCDRGGFLNFFREAEATIARLGTDEPHEHTTLMRELHTLKGNFGLFGMKPLAQLIHEIEGACLESGALPSAEDRQELQEAWTRFADNARSLLGESSRTLSVDRGSLERLLDAIGERRPHPELTRLGARLMHEPVAPKLSRMGERARALADRLGKGPVAVQVDADGVLAPADLNWLWQVLPHVVANSVDHGLDGQAERAASGKQTPGKLRIAAVELPSGLMIEVEDDGRGIDWGKVRARARELGLPADTHEQLVAALFSDGVTTRSEASEVSGRGIGLAAVEAACQEHGASIGIVSQPGKGTLFRFTVRNHDPLRRSDVA